MNATTKKVRLTLEIEVTACGSEDHERAMWTAAVAVTPTLSAGAFGPVKVVGVEAEDEHFCEEAAKAPTLPTQQATDAKTAGEVVMARGAQVAVAGEGRATEEGHEMGFTLPVARNSGLAFGLWGYSMDVALNGEGQGENPDLIAIEESDVYAAVADTIQAQDPPHAVKREVAGGTVWVEDRPSEMYAVLREAMFEAYRLAPHMPGTIRCGTDRLAPPSGIDPSWKFSANPGLECPDLMLDRGAKSLSDVLVTEGVLQEDQVLSPAAGTGAIDFAFPSKGEASAFLKRFNSWLSDRAMVVARKRRAAAEAARA